MTFLDYMCSYCEHEEHDTCWEIEPDIKCSCCIETIKQILIEDMEKRNNA